MSTPVLHAITVLGHDRPGIIADVTARLAEIGLNLEDSSMTLLRGHFAMTLVCRGDVVVGDLEQALAPVGADGSLDVVVRQVAEDDTAEPVGSPASVEAGAATSHLLTVHGGDRPGIVSTVVTQVARAGGNITDLTTRLSGELYLLVAEIALPPRADAAALGAAVDAAAASVGVRATLRPVEADEL